MLLYKHKSLLTVKRRHDRSNKMIYTVTFNPALDYAVSVGEIEYGATNRISDAEISFGGKGINVSIVLKHLGIESTAIAFTAGFTGAAIEESVKEQGIKTDFIHLPDGLSRINVKIKSDVETELNASGPTITECAMNELYAKLDRLKDGDTLVLAGSIPKNLPKDTYSAIMSRLGGRGIRFIVDATGELLTSVLPYKPFLIKPNFAELQEVNGEKLLTESDIADAAIKLHRTGAENVLVSNGDKCTIMLDKNERLYKVNVPQGKAINTVGAGDSMIAGFLYGLSDGDTVNALKAAVAAGSATAFSNGFARREDVERLIKGLSVL